MSVLLRDPWFNAMVDDVVAKQGGGFTPSQIAAFRKALAFTFENHPAARRILARHRPDLERQLPAPEPRIPLR